eukprot:TRINITY_DN83_c0_g1_i1.p1 TRINITY_DN83_c0_g1~~TRINITY_DN83_c0_g1_i1.p1  ORF type:complete len:486 (+),score=62.67 TRINITY_DN83_c0_g1_i1:28-1458(+)
MGHSRAQSRSETALFWGNEEVVTTIFDFLGFKAVLTGTANATNRIRPSGVCLACRKWANFAKKMTVLDMSGLEKMDDQRAASIISHFSHLNSVVLRECRTVKLARWPVLEGLTSLNVGGCANILADALQQLIKAQPRLTDLSIDYCTQITDLELPCLLLESLDISFCTQLASLEALKNLPKLRQLDAAGLSVEQMPCPRALERLVLDQCPELPLAEIQKLISRCECLSYLSFVECEKLQNCPNYKLPPSMSLTELRMRGTMQSDQTLKSVLNGMPNLRYLDAGNSEGIVCPSFPRHDTLRTLVLSQCSYLTDNAVESAARTLSSLTRLNVSSCDSLVRPNISSASLSFLDISNCTQLLTDAEPRAWLSCPFLETLFIGLNPELNDDELVFVTTLHSLRVLNLYRASGLHDPDFSPLVNVEVLNLTECWNLSDSVFEGVWSILPKLRTLHAVSLGIDSSEDDDEEEDGDEECSEDDE